MELKVNDLKIHKAALFEAITRAAFETNFEVDFQRNRYEVSVGFTTFSDGASYIPNKYQKLLYSEIFSIICFGGSLEDDSYRKLDRFNKHVYLKPVEMIQELCANFRNYDVDFLKLYSDALDEAIRAEADNNVD